MAQEETLNLAQDYLDESPATLSEEQLQKIASLFDIPLAQLKKIATQMVKDRKNIDSTEIAPPQE